MTNIPDDLLLFRLEDSHLPGTDLVSKVVLKDDRIKDILVEELVGAHAKPYYNLGRCVFTNNTTCDVLFVSNQPDQPPLLVEIQEKVNSSFLGRAINYSLAIQSEHGSLPLVTVFAVKGFSSQALESGFEVDKESQFAYNLPSPFWAEKCLIFSPNSIKEYDLELPMNKMVAIESFLSQQEPSLLTTKNKDDKSMQLFYTIAKEKFEKEVRVEEEKLLVIHDLCEKAETQFQKIVSSITSGLVDKAKAYATDGEAFFGLNKYKYQKRERETTPIDDLPDITAYPAEPDAKLKQGDLDYIEAFYNTGGRMKWESFFKQGQASKLFGAFGSHQELKVAYHNHKKLKALKKKKTAANEI